MTGLTAAASDNYDSNMVNSDHSHGSTNSAKTLDNFINPTLSEDEIRLNRLGYKQV